MTDEWRPSLIVRQNEGHVVLKDYYREEYFNLELNPDVLSSALPILYVKICSDRALKLSFFHGGVRSMITRMVEFERMSHRQFAGNSRRLTDEVVDG